MKKVALVFATFVFVSIASGRSPAPVGSPMSVMTPACQAAEFRQFDFWLGIWKMIGPKGKELGRSEISRVSEGCAVREQWMSASGKSGTSINYYAEADHQWHQDWVDGDGTILHLHGGVDGAAMVLQGDTKSAQGTMINRIT